MRVCVCVPGAENQPWNIKLCSNDTNNKPHQLEKNVLRFNCFFLIVSDVVHMCGPTAFSPDEIV